MVKTFSSVKCTFFSKQFKFVWFNKFGMVPITIILCCINLSFYIIIAFYTHLLSNTFFYTQSSPILS